jgi:hypothetical protein
MITHAMVATVRFVLIVLAYACRYTACGYWAGRQLIEETEIRRSVAVHRPPCQGHLPDRPVAEGSSGSFICPA